MKKIAIHSVPRSGSSWLGEIVNSSPSVSYAFQPLFSYAFKSYLHENSSSQDIEQFYEKIKNSSDDFIKQTEDRTSGKKPIFEKENKIEAVAYKEVRYHYIIDNLLKKDSKIKVVGLVRDPYSVINSWYNAPREFRRDLGWDLTEELLEAEKKNQNLKEEYFGLNKWIETTKLFNRLEREYPKNFILIKYEELCSNTIEIVKQLFVFLELEYTPQTIKFLTQKIEVSGTYSVMKNKRDNKIQLPEGVVDMITRELIRNELSVYVR